MQLNKHRLIKKYYLYFYEEILTYRFYNVIAILEHLFPISSMLDSGQKETSPQKAYLCSAMQLLTVSWHMKHTSWLAACLWAITKQREEVLPLLTQAAHRYLNGGKPWENFRTLPEFDDVRDDLQFAQAAEAGNLS